MLVQRSRYWTNNKLTYMLKSLVANKSRDVPQYICYTTTCCCLGHCPADLIVSIFRPSKAGIANVISSFKRQNIIYWK